MGIYFVEKIKEKGRKVIMLAISLQNTKCELDNGEQELLLDVLRCQ